MKDAIDIVLGIVTLVAVVFVADMVSNPISSAWNFAVQVCPFAA